MKTIFEKLQSHTVIPIYYNDDREQCIKILEKSYRNGIRIFEFVNRGEKALGNFECLIDFRNQYAKDMLLGIGTIKNEVDARSFLELDADFLVSPLVDPDIAKVARDYGKIWIPGAMTPTEIVSAEKLGSTIIKIFPASTVGNEFLKSIKPLFPDLKFIVTGGVSPDQRDVQRWFDSGASAVGLGSSLFSDFDDDQEFEIIIKNLINLKK